jgi:hypothetical protein
VYAPPGHVCTPDRYTQTFVDAAEVAAVGGGTHTSPEDEHDDKASASAATQTVACVVWGGGPVGVPPSGAQGPAGVGTIVGPYESPFGPLVRPIGPGGITHTPCCAVVSTSLPHKVPPLPSCTSQPIGPELGGSHAQGLHWAWALGLATW